MGATNWGFGTFYSGYLQNHQFIIDTQDSWSSIRNHWKTLVNMILCARVGPELTQCQQYLADYAPILTHCVVYNDHSSKHSRWRPNIMMFNQHRDPIIKQKWPYDRLIFIIGILAHRNKSFILKRGTARCHLQAGGSQWDGCHIIWYIEQNCTTTPQKKCLCIPRLNYDPNCYFESISHNQKTDWVPRFSPISIRKSTYGILL